MVSNGGQGLFLSLFGWNEKTGCLYLKNRKHNECIQILFGLVTGIFQLKHFAGSCDGISRFWPPGGRFLSIVLFKAKQSKLQQSWFTQKTKDTTLLCFMPRPFEFIHSWVLQYQLLLKLRDCSVGIYCGIQLLNQWSSLWSWFTVPSQNIGTSRPIILFL